MTETEELRARIVRLELEIANRQATMAGMYAPTARKEPITVLGVLSVLLALLLIGGVSIALADRFGIALPSFIPPASVIFSTPAAATPLPSARMLPGGATGGYTRIGETVLPAPTPRPPANDGGAAIPPTWTPWPIDDSATAQAATAAAQNLTATAESQSAIDKWLNGPPSTPMPTNQADFVNSFATPVPCANSQFIGYVSGPCSKPTPEE